jgi:hypothetical protein
MAALLAKSILLLTIIPSLASAAPHSRKNNVAASTGRAVYFITNDATNAVAALPIGQDGKLSAGTVTETGGEGSVAVDAEMQPATPDALVGQSALTVVGNVSFNFAVFYNRLAANDIVECLRSECRLKYSFHVGNLQLGPDMPNDGRPAS